MTDSQSFPPRFNVYTVEHHSQDAVYATTEVEQSADGLWVRATDVSTLLDDLATLRAEKDAKDDALAEIERDCLDTDRDAYDVVESVRIMAHRGQRGLK